MSENEKTSASAGVDVRLLGANEASILERVAAGVFDRPVDPYLAAEFLGDPRHHLAVAVADGAVVGMASAVHYVHPDKPAELWIDEIGVAPSWRRRGLGRRLLQALFERGRALGCREAWLATTPGNAAARGLFAAEGGAEEPAVCVTFRLDGPGTDTARLPGELD